MYLLDTNILSLILRGTAPQSLLDRLAQTAPEQRFLSSVTVVEAVEGALALVRKEETRKRGTQGHALLIRLVRDLSRYPTLLYDDEADRLFREMPAELKRRGSRDCRIAACALRHGCVLVTQNTADFVFIPNLVCQDWTIS
jgi:predicted nucleic acid-binding protein